MSKDNMSNMSKDVAYARNTESGCKWSNNLTCDKIHIVMKTCLNPAMADHYRGLKHANWHGLQIYLFIYSFTSLFIYTNRKITTT